MKSGFNGEIILERFDRLAAQNHRLIVTEFDSYHPNITERAKDVEDFLRMAYSYFRDSKFSKKFKIFKKFQFLTKFF